MRRFLCIKNAVVTLAFALFVMAAAGAAQAKAAPTYNPVTDMLESKDGGEYYVANVKKEEGSKLKAASFQKVTTESAIAMDKGGFKASPSKTAYLYWTTSDPSDLTEEQLKDTFTPNLRIDGYACKKMVVNFDYTNLGYSKMMVSGVTVTKNESGAKPAFLDDFASKVSWKPDPDAHWIEIGAFNGSYLQAKMAAGSKFVVYFRIDGTATQRPSKMVKVTVPKRAKAPSIKVDVKKLSLNIKNGYDFASEVIDYGATAVLSGSSISVSGRAIAFEEAGGLQWYTILPYNKDGVYENWDLTIKGNAIMPNVSYMPMDKKAEGAMANSYTSEKKTLDLMSDLKFGNLVPNMHSLLLVTRKTATTKKPASSMGFIVIDAAAGAPRIKRVDESKPQLKTIVTAAAFQFVTPTLENNYRLENENEGGADKVVLDKAPAKYEYAVVKQSDFNAGTINLASVSWKAIKTGTKIKDNIKSKYTLLSDPKNKIEAKIGDSCYLIIRRAGVSKSGTVASAMLITQFVKITDGWEWRIY